MQTASRAITLRTHTDYAHKITLPSEDEDENAIDWSSATFEAHIRTSPGATGDPLEEFTIADHTDEDPPYVLLTLTDAQTADLPPGLLAWDFAETRSNFTRIPVGGSLHVQQAVTHD